MGERNRRQPAGRSRQGERRPAARDRRQNQYYYDNNQGYYDNNQGYYDNNQGYYDNGQGYNGNGQGYNGNGQGYYDNGDQGYYGNSQGYYDDGQGYYDNGNQGYYGNDRGYYDNRQRYRDNGQGYYYDEAPGRKGGKRKPAKKKKKHKKLLFILELLLLFIMALVLFVFAQLARVKRESLGNVLVNAGVSSTGYRNIALFGVDSREGQLESGTNSDTIMVASINNKTGEIKLVSVYRDTYLDTTNGQYRKATECYAIGGAKQAVDMLNKNLDLDITDYVTVDFGAVIEAVDLVGGIELDITEEERKWLNGYLVETSAVTGVDYTTVDYAGTQTVSGIQAMAYCRIRYTEGWDFKRTQRQRIVLNKIFEKAKQKGVPTLISMVNTMLPNISTSLSNTEIISLASGIARYKISEESEGFPFDYLAADISAGDCVVPVNLAANVSQLHAYLFGQMGYTPSSTVAEISNTIIYNTGIQ